MIVYRIIKNLSFAAGHLMLDTLEVSGLDNVPERGPFLLIANHQSILDPILIQSACPRIVYTIAKSPQFNVPVIGPLMPYLAAFPVRRYQIDPQAVRFALRRLDEGRAVGVYVEGERSWDGNLQAPRLGTLRLLLKAGVPVVTATIQGSFDVWPRWEKPRPEGNVRIQFGSPMRFPQSDSRDERNRLLPDVAQRLMSALREPMSAPTG